MYACLQFDAFEILLDPYGAYEFIKTIESVR